MCSELESALFRALPQRAVSRFCVALAALLLLGAPPAMAEPRHAIAMHGEPALKPGFTHFPYANPKAPKGGALVLADQGSFDSLNPLIIKGAFPAGLRDFVYESLMARSFDEPFTLYGLIASSIDTPDDRSEATFRLDPKARFSDGHPVTAADVVFSWQTLRDKGRPNHRTYYAKVEKVETPDPLTVRFIFKNANDRELPLILGLMPILPKHVFETREFEKASLDIPIGSGPYTVGKVDPGAGITYRRNPDYWGRDLPVNRGRYNFDTVRYEYFRDANSMFEAFKKGLYDLREETNSGRWASSYDFPALKAGKVKKSIVPVGTPAGFAAFAFNTRREIFADIRVRKALSLMFDFTWVNKHLFHGLFKRTQSVFDRSSLSSHGVKASEYERKLLAPFPDAVLPGIMDGTFSLPRHDGSGRDRKQQRAAIKLLRGAGYKLQNGVMVGGASGKALEFEILCATRAQERLALNFSGSLKRIGVTARVRLVDSAQYQRRRQTFDFDLVQTLWLSSLSPGNEQAFRWGSAAASQEGSFNYAGVKSPAADAMIKAMLAATSRKDFTDAVRALDRVLLSGYYTIPLYHQSGQWLAWWKKITGPDVIPLYGNRTDLWWYRGDEPG